MNGVDVGVNTARLDGLRLNLEQTVESVVCHNIENSHFDKQSLSFSTLTPVCFCLFVLFVCFVCFF